MPKPILALLVALAAFAVQPAKAQTAEPTLVFAAASLKNALDTAVGRLH